MAVTASERATKRKERRAANVASGKITAEQAAKRDARDAKRAEARGAVKSRIKSLTGGGAYKDVAEKVVDAVSKFSAGRGGKIQPVNRQPASGMTYGGGYLNDIVESDSWGTIENAAAQRQYDDEQAAASDSMNDPRGVYNARYDPETGSTGEYMGPPTTFQGPGPSNSVRYPGDALDRLNSPTPTTGSSGSYTPTTKQNPKNKVTTPGELTDSDIQQLNKYQISLENKAKKSGLTAAESAKLEDYYRREESYRQRGGYEAEAPGEGDKKAPAPASTGWMNAGTGQSGLGSPPAAASAKPKAGYSPSTAKISGNKAQEEDGTWSPRSSFPKNDPRYSPISPAGGKASSTPAASKPGTQASSRTSVPVKKADSAAVKAAKSLHTAQRWDKGKEAAQVAATLKKYPGGQIARVAAAEKKAGKAPVASGYKAKTTTTTSGGGSGVKVSGTGGAGKNATNTNTTVKPKAVYVQPRMDPGDPARKPSTTTTKTSGGRSIGGSYATTKPSAKLTGASASKTYGTGQTVANANRVKAKSAQTPAPRTVVDPSGRRPAAAAPRVVGGAKVTGTSVSKTYSPGKTVAAANAAKIPSAKTAIPKVTIDPSGRLAAPKKKK